MALQKELKKARNAVEKSKQANFAASMQAQARPSHAAVACHHAPVIQCGTRVLISLWDSLMFGRVLKRTTIF